ncbi:maf protein [Paraglaciecola sp. T6c]|uniref:7-methyl-GTP pyrophosphatase n=1 Tax=Pseudoalteromonas atlantica (strain T6c / ATCC BAA-1087) TaxID=3042615 RepID=NTPPB_PSEA6|nr:Maf family protein [Paraglaciecola sp. T6c]Q15TZ2.1 RecName: Full=7-methyl-GTP pyrophosphatase; Short=m(7)GTP pyrophosphatase [Paraglaciecola sp. T6c]ABG40646.1 maf protein [Paraglaciecola sp. T6c]
MKLILASTSPYRKNILEKLCIPFSCASPSADETPMNNESANTLVARLAAEKALSVGVTQKGLIIGSDQVACVDGVILGKPGNKLKAFDQLTQLSGKTVTFFTGLSLLDSKTQRQETIVETFDVIFKSLSAKQISRYLELEEPYDCAGSFKSEGLGIALFSSLDGRDPNTLIGLPLIALVAMLKKFEIDVFEHMQ